MSLMIYKLIFLCLVFSSFLYFFDLKLSPQVKKYKTKHQIHSTYVSRFSFLSVILALFLFLILFNIKISLIYILIISAFGLIGLIEDFKNILNPKLRLMLLFLLSLIFFYNQEFISYPYIDLPILNLLSSYEVFNIIFFSIALVAIINGLNMIDGLNGLSSITIISIITPLFILSNSLILLFALVITINFFAFNFPKARYFFGDGCIYFFGGLIGIEIIHFYGENQLPSWGGVLLILYPITEISFSILRRFFIDNTSITNPDNNHLHSIIYKLIKSLKIKNPNPVSSLIIFPLCFIPPYFWYVFNNKIVSIFISSFIFISTYIVFYFALLVLLKKRDN